MGAPVDDAASLIDQALFIEVAESLADSLGAGIVHGEAAAFPVTGHAHALLLLHDTVAVLGFPVPHPLQELVPAQVVAGLALLLAENLFHLDLCGNARVVNAGQPQGGVSLHTLIAGQNVLKRGVKGVAHVELAGDIGRRHHDGEGLFIRIDLSLEVAALHPHIINFLFHSLWFIDFRKFFHFHFSCYILILSLSNRCRYAPADAPRSCVSLPVFHRLTPFNDKRPEAKGFRAIKYRGTT